MVSVEKAVIARLHKKGVNFEILVDPDKSLEMKRGGAVAVEDVLAAQEIFKDAHKGERASAQDLEDCFSTADIMKVAEAIVKHGVIQLTTEQKHHMIEEKRKQIADIISKQGIDPKTKTPHPPQRILNAMDQVPEMDDEKVKGYGKKDPNNRPDSRLGKAYPLVVFAEYPQVEQQDNKNKYQENGKEKDLIC